MSSAMLAHSKVRLSVVMKKCYKMTSCSSIDLAIDKISDDANYQPKVHAVLK